jgi:hypothetical protein
LDVESAKSRFRIGVGIWSFPLIVAQSNPKL